MNRYRIHQIKLRPGEPESHIPDKIKEKTGRNVRIRDIRIVKRSIDARNKPDVRVVYSVDFSTDASCPGLSAPPDSLYEYPFKDAFDGKDAPRPVIIGFGPCGMFCGLALSAMGLRPVIIERGRDVAQRVRDVDAFRTGRILDPESNVQFGEGGAGTFSDGKLTTGIKDIRVGKVLREFVDAGADSSILIDAKPHIGTDVLRRILVNIRKKIIVNGGEIHFGERLESLKIRGGEVTGVNTSEGEYSAGSVVLAIGHSARDTVEMLYDSGIDIVQKPFSIGARIQHPQKMIDEAQYGDASLAQILGPAVYKLSHRCECGRGVYTFCMCPGGEVITASSEPSGVVTNGMSFSDRGGSFANSGLLCDVRTADFGSDHPLAGIEFQRKYERAAFELGGGDYTAPSSALADFAKSDAAECLPDFAVSCIDEALPYLGRKLSGFDSPDALMTSVESRSSSPVRILRGRDMMCAVKGVYPCGEGAGYAGGIVSSAVDGIKAAEKIAERTEKIMR
ncbi:MAG: NAD(P)/FAD-dependent oxidoreductase [Anaerovoracaceae bacterium]|jgi:uncharacterized FAD-dependent dehydrogenase